MSWKPLLRQVFVCSGPWTLYFTLGLYTGLPTVLIPQLRRSNQTISDDKASWFPAALIYCGIPWLFITSALLTYIGRKKSHITVCTSSLIGSIIYFFSTDIDHFMTGQIFQGALTACYLTTNVVILTECVQTKYRGIFLTLKSATFFWGILVSNAIGTYFHHKNIATLGIVCGVYTLINVVAWPESPLWLASKGKFVECAAAHNWLKGDEEDSRRELQKMLILYENRRNQEHWSLQTIWKTITTMQFFKPILLSNLLVCLYSFSGKLVCTVYAIDILKKVTNNEASAYYGMLILDGVTVLSMYLGCFLCRLVRRRVLLIGFSITGIMFLLLISIYLYLVKINVITENNYVSMIFLAGYSISISCGPMIMSTTIIGELLPLDSRILSMCIIAISFKITYGTFLKLSPLCFRHLKMHGTFALFAGLSTVCVFLVYIYLPETSDKTLEEINSMFNRNDNNVTEDSEKMIDSNVKNSK